MVGIATQPEQVAKLLTPYKSNLKGMPMAIGKSRINYLEKWDTRFGQSERVVVRDENGKFVSNYSLTALRKSPPAPLSRKG